MIPLGEMQTCHAQGKGRQVTKLEAGRQRERALKLARTKNDSDAPHITPLHSTPPPQYPTTTVPPTREKEGVDY